MPRHASHSVSCLNSAGNFYDAPRHPRLFDPTRKGNRPFTLAAGIDPCLGGHLARCEPRLLLDEWLKHIPEFRVKPEPTPRYS
jgi:cytochrome P450